MPFRMFVDADGVPYSEYGEYRGLDIGRQRSVLAVAERGLWLWNEYLRDDAAAVLLSYDWERWPENKDGQPLDHDAAVRMFWNCAAWMRDEIRDEPGFSAWVYPYPMSYGTSKGWKSAHAQAVGLQLLARASVIAGDPAWCEKQAALLAAFRVPLADGGLLDTADSDVLWFEKFADPANQKPRVLNGMLFAILGLLDLAAITEDREAGALARVGIGSVKALLPEFDLDGWTAYDIMKKPCSPHYHSIHVRQLEILAEATQDEELAGWAERWAAYRRDDG